MERFIIVACKVQHLLKYRALILSILFKTTMDKTFILLACKAVKISMWLLACKEFPFWWLYGNSKFFKLHCSCCLCNVCMCVIIIISCLFFVFVHSVRSSCYGCSFFFYLRHYFSFSVFNSSGCVLCFVHSAGVILFSCFHFSGAAEYLLELCVPFYLA